MDFESIGIPSMSDNVDISMYLQNLVISPQTQNTGRISADSAVRCGNPAHFMS